MCSGCVLNPGLVTGSFCSESGARRDNLAKECAACKQTLVDNLKEISKQTQEENDVEIVQFQRT